MKKLLSVFLSIIMLLSITAGLDLSAYAETSGDYEYEILDDGTVEIYKYYGSESNVTIPSEIDGYIVTSIGDVSFRECTSIVKVIIPNSVIIIDDYAFNDCTGLTDITIPSSVISIGEGAFLGCNSLKSVVIPNGVLSICSYAFLQCSSLENVVLPDSVKKIGSAAFQETAIYYNNWINDVLYIGNHLIEARVFVEIYIDENVITIADDAFYGCGVTNINMDVNNKNYSSENGVLYNKNKTRLIKYPAGKVESSFTIPNSVISIDDRAFSSCENLTNITIPDSVVSIDTGAFMNCTSLTSITIPDSVISIGRQAFYYCTNLSNIAIGYGVISIDGGAFEDTAYYNNQSNWINGVLYIGNCLIEANYETVSEAYSIKSGTTVIADYAFSSCGSLTCITIPDSVTSIGDGAFYYCDSLTSITIPDSVISIGDSAFDYCDSLTSITIPDSVTSIGIWAFYHCDNLIIYGYKGSTAEAYANEEGKKFVALDEKCSHTWNNGTEIKAVTCTDDGVKTYTCMVCGETKTETIPATGHSYDNGIVTQKATCKAAGTKTYTCTKCKATKTETIAKTTSHVYKTTTTKATTKKNGSKVTKCTVCGAKKSTTTIYYPKTISLSATSYTYDGKVKKPSVTVKDSKGKKIAASNYTVSYASGRKAVGTYKVTIKFKGNYSGTVKKTFTIKPKATTLSSVTAKSKGFTVKWKKLTTQTTGYQIQYSTSSKFSSAKTVTVSKNKTTSKTVSKLKAKKKYYVRVRTYKTVKVNGKSTKIYSAWSKSKAVTTKK